MENKQDILNETVRLETNLLPISSIKIEVKKEPAETLEICSSVNISKVELHNHIQSFKQEPSLDFMEHKQLHQDASIKIESDSFLNQPEVELEPEVKKVKGELMAEEYDFLESMITEECDLPIKCEDDFEKASASKPQSEVKRKQKQHKFLYPSVKEYTKKICIGRKKKRSLKDANSINRCPYCGKWYCKKNELLQHILSYRVKKSVFSKKSLHKNEISVGVEDDNVTNNDEVETKSLQVECEICFKILQKYNLKTHMYVHTGEKKFQCDLCLKRFTQKSNLNTHKRSCCTLYQCEICFKTFKSNTIKNHMYTHSDETTMRCSICFKVFRRHDNFAVHKCFDDKDKAFNCYLCPKFFKRKHDLINHINIHTGVIKYQCTMCPKVFKKQSTRNEHMYSHSGQRNFKCNMCSKAFSSKSILQRHKQIHSDTKQHSCVVCSKSFTTKPCLRRHMNTHNNDEIYQCNVCLKEFKKKVSLICHMSIHTGNYKYKCEYCPKSFSRKEPLYTHQYNHTNEKPYQCDICPEAFFSNSALKNHNIFHAASKGKDDKPFKCDICPRVFKLVSSLKNHVQKDHTGKKPFKCQTCLVHFATQDSLDAHIFKLHTKKEFECKVCFQNFSHRTTMNKHIRLKHKANGKPKTVEKKFECEFCSKKFVFEGSKRMHVKNMTCLK